MGLSSRDETAPLSLRTVWLPCGRVSLPTGLYCMLRDETTTSGCILGTLYEAIRTIQVDRRTGAYRAGRLALLSPFEHLAGFCGVAWMASVSWFIECRTTKSACSSFELRTIHLAASLDAKHQAFCRQTYIPRRDCRPLHPLQLFHSRSRKHLQSQPLRLAQRRGSI